MTFYIRFYNAERLRHVRLREKTAMTLSDGFPYSVRGLEHICVDGPLHSWNSKRI